MLASYFHLLIGGKLNELEIIPLNDSISATLHIDDLCATTTVGINCDSNEDEFWLNNEKQEISKNKRLVRCLQAGELRREN